MISPESQRAAARTLTELKTALDNLPGDVRVISYQETVYPNLQKTMIHVEVEFNDSALTLMWTRKNSHKPTIPQDTL